MKRNTPDHPKVEMLCGYLDCDLAKTVGTLELLWHFTAKFTPSGNIGIYPNEVIAKRVGWTGIPLQLIESLIAARFLDTHPEHRIVVHDWHEHCEDAIHVFLARHTQTFATGQLPNMSRMKKEERTTLEAKYAQKAHKKRVKSALPLPLPLPLPLYDPPSETLEGTPPPDDIYSKMVIKAQNNILATFPKAKFPTSGSKQFREQCDAIRQLIELDHYTQEQVCATFKWLWHSESKQAVFWRTNVQSIANLRHKKRGDTLHKFDKVFADCEADGKHE